MSYWPTYVIGQPIFIWIGDKFLYGVVLVLSSEKAIGVDSKFFLLVMDSPEDASSAS